MGFIHNILKGRTPSPAEQAARYVISGGAAFAVDFLLLKLCTDLLGLHYILSALVGFSAGLIITYTLSIKWVFDRRRIADPRAEFSLFALIGIVGLGLTALFMWLFTSVAGIHYLVSKILTTIVVTGWNFVAKKKILF